MFFPNNTGTGQSQFAIAEHFDDSTLVKIDGVTRINNGNWDIPNTTGELTLPAGWHDVEFRFGEGGGGWGPSDSMNWVANPPAGTAAGFGVDFTLPIDGANPPTQANFTRPVDPGDGSVFRFVHPSAGVVQVDAGATLKLGAVRGANAVNLAANSRLELHGATSKIKSTALSLPGTPTAPTATLDVTDASLILDYADAGSNPSADVRSRIVAGRGGTDLLGTWDGKGITSSAAQADNSTLSVGWANNADLPLGAYTDFGGQTVDDTAVLIRGTRIGDANLDGVVNDDDVTIVGATYGMTSGASWALGDFNYDGAVNDDDVTLLGALYDPSAAPIGGAPAVAATSGTVAAVPEPATWLMLSLGGLGAGLFGWRKRRKA
jgi:hypothetical protein